MAARGTLLALALAACGGDQGFNNSSDPTGGDVGVGAIEVDPEEIVFTALDWENGTSHSEFLTVRNAGEHDLVVYEIGLTNSGGGVFDLDEAQTEDRTVLAPGAEREFTVVATLTEYAVVEGELRVLSNDADEPDLRVRLVAVPAGWKEDTGGGDTGGGGAGTGGGGDTGGA